MKKISKKRIPKEMMMLGGYLKSVRTDFGLSMHDVARRASLTPSYISKIEGGSTFQTISAHALIEFSRVYNIPPQLILERSGFMPENEDELPGIASYLRIKYKAPQNAVQEMEIAWEIIKKKYNI